MFTGIIEAMGKVVKFESEKLWIRVPFRRLDAGESVSVNGVCLTVAARRGKAYRFDVGPETVRVTTLASLKAGETVNLERALRMGDRLGGHCLTGHVEAMGRVTRIQKDGRSRWFDFKLPAALSRYTLAKGSIAIDGVSLTIAAKTRSGVRIMVIPHTLAWTTLGGRKAGDRVNVETDMMAKYAVSREGKKSNGVFKHSGRD
jgi:riboflavin synthase